MGEWLLSRRDRLIVARHEYLFSVISQSCSSSSFVLVRFSGDPSEPSAACFLRSSLFHPGNPPTEDENEDEDDWPAIHLQARSAW
jgi:hypothetical protein